MDPPLTQLSDMYSDTHLFIWTHYCNLLEIKHLSSRDRVTRVFPNSLLARPSESCPPFIPITREKNNVVSMMRTLSMEAL